MKGREWTEQIFAFKQEVKKILKKNGENICNLYGIRNGIMIKLTGKIFKKY